MHKRGTLYRPGQSTPALEALENRRMLSASSEQQAAGSSIQNPQSAIQNGLTATYFDNLDFTGPSITRIDPAIDFKWGWGSPDPAIGGDTFSARWTGQLTAPQTGQYTFHLTADDGIRLWIGGNLLIDHWKDSPGETRTATTTLQANHAYDLKLAYYENKVGAKIQLAWTTPTQSRHLIPTQYLNPTFVEQTQTQVSAHPPTGQQAAESPVIEPAPVSLAAPAPSPPPEITSPPPATSGDGPNTPEGLRLASVPTTTIGDPFRIKRVTGQHYYNGRVYVGDFNLSAGNGLPAQGRGNLSPGGADGLAISNSHRVLVEHWSAFWGVDETVSIHGHPKYGPTSDVVLKNVMVAESLKDNRHEKGSHGCGMLIGWEVSNVLLWENVHAHHWVRALFDVTVDQHDVTIEVANTIVYNWEREVFKVGKTPAAVEGGYEAKVNLRNSLFIVGPDTAELTPQMFRTRGAPWYIENCWVLHPDGSITDLRDHLSPADRAALSPTPHEMDFSWAGYDPAKLYSTGELLEQVLPFAGPVQRNVFENQVIRDILHRTGRILNSPDQYLRSSSTQPVSSLVFDSTLELIAAIRDPDQS